ncbi:nucleotidyl transferase AbiEii/AbiGii toxin family protein [Mesorhizobium sp.]|uniref:nucleotidyl transferase AbiEii/AbiGii toxin family protein n=1 Tax=Mesorhizobium sp. TaxID=1871066 RepID=UPI0025DB623E|nr:nucleotidyl transferase AbiEii/AbiGii toxin family protein [Mesorhizobium sp.]
MRQVQLLVRTLPYIARHEEFALKGGTAINLFYRDMPRLSVDIDLTYVPIVDRETTLKGIDTTLERLREDLLRNLRGVSVQRIAGGGNNDTRVLVRQGRARNGAPARTANCERHGRRHIWVCRDAGPLVRGSFRRKAPCIC